MTYLISAIILFVLPQLAFVVWVIWLKPMRGRKKQHLPGYRNPPPPPPKRIITKKETLTAFLMWRDEEIDGYADKDTVDTIVDQYLKEEC